MPRRYYRSGKAAGRRGRPTTQVGQMLQDYFQSVRHAQDFSGLASGADTGVVLVDNSADFQNSILKWGKLKISWYYDGPDVIGGLWEARHLLVAILKQDQDDTGTYYAMDSDEVVRELRNDKKLMRGPWVIQTPEIVSQGLLNPMATIMKPIVLKNFVMDREEDLIINFTSIDDAAFTAQSQKMQFMQFGYVRVVK